MAEGVTMTNKYKTLLPNPFENSFKKVLTKGKKKSKKKVQKKRTK